jgi:Protein of unknown function with HXXEE motif
MHLRLVTAGNSIPPMETHGRWPLVAAAATAPVTAAAVRRPALRPFAALLAHQTEEWFWPGSFLPWMNQTVLGSDDPEFPIDRRTAFVINVVLGWGGSFAAARPDIAAAPATALYVSHFGNAALHLSWALRHRKYDPGVVTAALTLIPASVLGLRQLYTDPDVSARARRIGLTGGAALGAGLLPALNMRLRSRRRSRLRAAKV